MRILCFNLPELGFAQPKVFYACLVGRQGLEPRTNRL